MRTLMEKAVGVFCTCREKKITLAVAESCTGGLLSSALVENPGSSSVFDCGFITYSNESKQEMLGVSPQMIDDEGEVSEAVARAMAEGALAHSRADYTVAITGLAGPGGATEGKPLGLVHVASAMRNGETIHEMHIFDGSRDDIRKAATMTALDMLLDRARSHGQKASGDGGV